MPNADNGWHNKAATTAEDGLSDEGADGSVVDCVHPEGEDFKLQQIFDELFEELDVPIDVDRFCNEVIEEGIAAENAAHGCGQIGRVVQQPAATAGGPFPPHGGGQRQQEGARQTEMPIGALPGDDGGFDAYGGGGGRGEQHNPDGHWAEHCDHIDDEQLVGVGRGRWGRGGSARSAADKALSPHNYCARAPSPPNHQNFSPQNNHQIRHNNNHQPNNQQQQNQNHQNNNVNHIYHHQYPPHHQQHHQSISSSDSPLSDNGFLLQQKHQHDHISSYHQHHDSLSQHHHHHLPQQPHHQQPSHHQNIIVVQNNGNDIHPTAVAAYHKVPSPMEFSLSSSPADFDHNTIAVDDHSTVTTTMMLLDTEEGGKQYDHIEGHQEDENSIDVGGMEDFQQQKEFNYANEAAANGMDAFCFGVQDHDQLEVENNDDTFIGWHPQENEEEEARQTMALEAMNLPGSGLGLGDDVLSPFSSHFPFSSESLSSNSSSSFHPDNDDDDATLLSSNFHHPHHYTLSSL